MNHAVRMPSPTSVPGSHVSGIISEVATKTVQARVPAATPNHQFPDTEVSKSEGLCAEEDLLEVFLTPHFGQISASFLIISLQLLQYISSPDGFSSDITSNCILD